MAWFRTGTINVTNGSTAVVGAGTTWIANVGIGEALLAPDGKLYEIANIASDTSITLGSAYLGTTQTGQAYVIVPSQSYIRDLAAQAATLVNNYATFYNTVGQGKFPDGTLAAPAVAFSSDTNTGFYHSGTDEVTLVAGGVAVAKWTSLGFTALGSVPFTTKHGHANDSLTGAESFTAYTVNGAGVGIVGSHAGIFGGLPNSLCTYVYGSGNEYSIATNGSKRLIVEDSGIKVVSVAMSDPSLNANSVVVQSVGISGHIQLATSIQSTSPYAVSMQVKHHSSNGQAFPLALNPSGGRVLIGTTSDDGVNKLQVSGSIKATSLNTTGSVGVGATPPGYPGTVLYTRVGNCGSFYGDGTAYTWSTGMAQNLVKTGTSAWKYIVTGPAGVALYEQVNGSHTWFSGANGTGGDVASITQHMTLTDTGSLLIGSTVDDGVNKLQVNGQIKSSADKINLTTAKTPASATAAGTQGDICWDANYVYVCVATNTWKRSAITTW